MTDQSPRHFRREQYRTTLRSDFLRTHARQRAFRRFAADRFGRKTIFTFSLLWYTIATVIMAFQTHVFGLNLWRAIAGVSWCGWRLARRAKE